MKHYPITSLIGLTTINIELTSRCNKSCWMCGRRKLEKNYPELCNWGDMDFLLFKKIVAQIPPGIIVQLHNNGEPLLYPALGQAIKMLKNKDCIVNFDTNGKLLLKKANEIIDNLDTLTISVIENDPEGDEQYEIVKKFLEIKEDKKPLMVYRLLGNVGISPDLSKPYKSFPNDSTKLRNELYEKRKDRWYEFPGIVATRVLHSPMGSFDYEKKPTVPEMGICQDLLNHLVIDRLGNVSVCIRFDPKGELRIGNINKDYLIDLWYSDKRKKLIEEHLKGNRKINPVCSKCEFYGCPTPY